MDNIDLNALKNDTVINTFNECIDKLLEEEKNFHYIQLDSIDEYYNLLDSINKLYIIKSYLSDGNHNWEEAIEKADKIEAELSCENAHIVSMADNKIVKIINQYEVLSLIKYNSRGERITLWEQ